MSENGIFNLFTSKNDNYGNKTFLDTNNFISKVAFLLLVIFIFIMVLRIGIVIMTYFLENNKSPHLMDGMVNASQMLIYKQDPNESGSKTIYRSNNATDGIEFTWSVWILINNLTSRNTESYKHIFSKGNSNIQENGLIYPNNAPGLYIAPNTNTLVVMMNTFNVINEEITIPNIPINKWVNVIIRCKNTTFDVYVNGTISRSINLVGVPKQNYGDVYVAMNGGFDGYISNLWYYNYSLGTAAIQSIAENGPNTKLIGSTGVNDKYRDYLSLRWFFYGAGDTYNPYDNFGNYPFKNI